MTHMERLVALLIDHYIPFEITQCWNTPQVWYPNKENAVCDVICHRGSYGGNEGLLEIMGLLTDEEAEYDSVVGWLTSGEVFNRILDHYNENLRDK